MNIFYYDLNTLPAAELLHAVETVRKETGDRVVALPKDSKLLLNCDLN